MKRDLQEISHAIYRFVLQRLNQCAHAIADRNAVDTDLKSWGVVASDVTLRANHQNVQSPLMSMFTGALRPSKISSLRLRCGVFFTPKALFSTTLFCVMRELRIPSIAGSL